MEQNQSGEQQPSLPPVGQTPQKSNNKVLWIILAIVIVLGIIALVGGYFVMKSIRARVSQKVGQSIGENLLEQAIEQGTGKKANVSADGKTVNIETDEGTFTASEEGNIKLSSDFPSDVFMYPDAKISFSTTTPANAADGTKASFMVAYTLNQSVTDVVAKYKAEMAKNGWTLETEGNYGAIMINFNKGDRSILLTVSDSEGGATGSTGVSLTGAEK